MKISYLTLIFILVYDVACVCSEDTEAEKSSRSTGDNIACYQCRTDRHHGCASGDMDPRYLNNCTRPDKFTGKIFCRKIHQLLYFTKNHDEAVIRECAFDVEGFSKPRFSCYKTKWVVDSYQEICDCETLGCNTAVTSHQLDHVLYLMLLTYCLSSLPLANKCIVT